MTTSGLLVVAGSQTVSSSIAQKGEKEYHSNIFKYSLGGGKWRRKYAHSEYQALSLVNLAAGQNKTEVGATRSVV